MEYTEDDFIELANECVGYVEEILLEDIRDDLKNILNRLLDDCYDSNLQTFLEEASMDDVEDLYRKILGRREEGLISNFADEKDLDYNYIIDEVIDILGSNVEYMTEIIYEDLLKFADEHIDDPKVNKYMTGYQLKELDDKVGDKITSYIDRDYDKRDRCFIDIDGKIIVSDEGQTHTQLVNSYLENLDKETFEDDFYRLDNENMKDFAEKFGFGEIDDGIFFVEEADLYGNMKAKDIVNDLLKSGVDYEKIYIIDNDVLTRMAVKKGEIDG